MSAPWLPDQALAELPPRASRRSFLGVRNHAKGANAKQQIDAALADPSLRRHQGGSAELLAEDVSLELSDMAKVKAWAERVKVRRRCAHRTVFPSLDADIRASSLPPPAWTSSSVARP